MRSCVPSCCFPLSPPLLLPPFVDVDVEEGGASHECVEIRQEPLHSPAPPPIHLGRRTLLLHLGGEEGRGGRLDCSFFFLPCGKEEEEVGNCGRGWWLVTQAGSKARDTATTEKPLQTHRCTERREEGPPFSVVKAYPANQGRYIAWYTTWYLFLPCLRYVSCPAG